jgi:hypothetical protein
MYIDESGVPSNKDASKYYLLSGIIVHHDNIKSMKKSVFNYKHIDFVNNYIDAEIHTHNICKAKDEFSSILKGEKDKLLDNLYKMISDLPILIITIVIDKELLKQEKPSWKIFKTAWTILITRFDQYLESLNNGEKGQVKIDRSTTEQRQELERIMSDMRQNKKKWQRIDNIEGDPAFAISHGTEGIQVADAIAYCTSKYLGDNAHFRKNYWGIIEKLSHTKDGKILGYGLIIYPPTNIRKVEGTRP